MTGYAPTRDAECRLRSLEWIPVPPWMRASRVIVRMAETRVWRMPAVAMRGSGVLVADDVAARPVQRHAIAATARLVAVRWLVLSCSRRS